MHVVATAGHVDHGKSTLLRAMTGMEPDRWREERERGLTIDLGFVWADLEDDPDDPVTVAFVDVPGHERFIGNMLAGAGAVRVALFVVAADDGWSAQSQEHLDILDLLGVGGAVVAVTKVDLAGEERAAQVAADVERRLARTSLAGAPVVHTDATTGHGVPQLVRALVTRLRTTEDLPDQRRARVWVDRSFSVSGAGTVVTGTLAGGTLQVGDVVAVLPGPDGRGLPARIRGLQALGEPAERVRPPARVAINLGGVDQEEIKRGDAVVTGASDPALAWVCSDTLDTWVRVLAGHTVDRAGAWHLHVGSAETTCTVHPLLNEPVPGGGQGHVRLLLDRPLPLQHGDRFVLREAGRRATVAGGQVLDPRPRRRVRGVDRRLARAEHLDAIRTAEDPLPALLAASGGWRPAAQALGAAGRRPDADLPEGCGRVERWLVTEATIEGWSARLRAALAQADPAIGLDRAKLAAALDDDLDPGLAGAIPDLCVSEGSISRRGPRYVLPEHAETVDTAAQDRREAFLEALDVDPLAPPTLAEAQAAAGLSGQELQQLLQSGRIVRCGAIAFTREAVDGAASILRERFGDQRGFTAAEARDAWGTTRKYAIPLLEHLDATGVTRFDGQIRHLRAQRQQAR